MSLRHRMVSMLGGAIVVMVGSTGMCDAEAGLAKVIVNTGVQEFTPQRVTIQVGDRVTWVNRDHDTHSLVSAGSASRRSGVAPEALLINTTLPPGASYTHTFVESGTYYYFCANHTQVWGIVVAE